MLAILTLLAAVVLPGLSVLGARPLRAQAERFASDLELARVRTVLLGVPHRVVIDLEGGAWRVEWLVTEAEALGEKTPSALEPAAAANPRARLDLTPPLGETPEYRPVPVSAGRTSTLEDDLVFSRIDTTQGPVNRGKVAIGFERDGTADPTRVLLADEHGHTVAVDVEPLEETVRVHDVEK